ncbi:MAG: hypothetical protein RLN77_05410, partial [Rhodospirillales bacterium]
MIAITIFGKIALSGAGRRQVIDFIDFFFETQFQLQIIEKPADVIGGKSQMKGAAGGDAIRGPEVAAPHA